jgi:hypothetical protein
LADGLTVDPKTPRQAPPTAADRRGSDRVALDSEVSVQFDPTPILGPGQNISPEGVFFVAAGSIRVQVTISGRDEAYEGELVRLQSMGEGKLGLAVRFIRRL